jgi:hypothetical protein
LIKGEYAVKAKAVIIIVFLASVFFLSSVKAQDTSPSLFNAQPIVIGQMCSNTCRTVTLCFTFGGGGSFTVTQVMMPEPFANWMTPTQSLPVTCDIQNPTLSYNITVPKGVDAGNQTGLVTVSGIDSYGNTESATTTISIHIENPPSSQLTLLGNGGWQTITNPLLIAGIAAFIILMLAALLVKRRK